MKCVFCGYDGDTKSVSHIVPESLGGKNSPIANVGVTCDACNQYFGQKVESKALKSFPLIGFRVLSGVKTKKGKVSNFISTAGRVFGTAKPRVVELEPLNEEIQSKVLLSQKTQFRVIAEVTEPLPVCRLLIKMGLEQLGNHFHEVAMSERMNAARDFARKPKRGSSWWFILRSNPEELFNENLVGLESAIQISEYQGILVATLELPGISTITPLESGVLPPNKNELAEPEYRIIWSRC